MVSGRIPGCRLSIPVQALVILTTLPWVRPACQGGLFGHPAARRATHRVHTWLSCLAHLLPLPASPFVSGSDASECAAVVIFFQARASRTAGNAS